MRWPGVGNAVAKMWGAEKKKCQEQVPEGWTPGEVDSL